MSGETRQVNSNAQFDLGFSAPTREVVKIAEPVADERFLTGAEGEFFFGSQRLDEYLNAIALGWVLRLRALLEEMSWEDLTKSYTDDGRRAIHPRVLVGLIVYGILRQQWSLRQLEQLALSDLGAMWVTGRLQPDHSTIGKFIVKHAEVLSAEFFVTLVKHLVSKLKITAGTVAIDGTVIEAAVSHFNVLRAEALKQSELSEQARAILEERKTEREAKGRDGDATMLAPGEPEAVVQQTKQDTWRPSYKPSALRHESGLVIAQGVHASSETAPVASLLSQHLAVFAIEPPRLLADAGYSSVKLLEDLSNRNIDALIVAGANTREPWVKQQRQGKFPKTNFRYDATADLYHCPAGRTLVRARPARDQRGRKYVVYEGRECSSCPLLAQCTKSTRRRINRYEGEEYKEAMAQVLQQPAALKQWRRRAGIIEPLFAELRERQRLTRFHRRGIEKVRVEFALHCAAFNLRLAVGGRAFAVIFSLFQRTAGGRWQLLASVWILQPPVCDRNS